MKRVIVESPYAGNTPEQLARNVRYARACIRDCLLRGEAPYASHLLYTQDGVLRDEVPEEREHGIQAGFAWRNAGELTAVYVDYGVSRGMQYGIDHASQVGSPVEERKLCKCVCACLLCMGHDADCVLYAVEMNR